MVGQCTLLGKSVVCLCPVPWDTGEDMIFQGQDDCGPPCPVLETTSQSPMLGVLRPGAEAWVKSLMPVDGFVVSHGRWALRWRYSRNNDTLPSWAFFLWGKLCFSWRGNYFWTSHLLLFTSFLSCTPMVNQLYAFKSEIQLFLLVCLTMIVFNAQKMKWSSIWKTQLKNSASVFLWFLAGSKLFPPRNFRHLALSNYSLNFIS